MKILAWCALALPVALGSWSPLRAELLTFTLDPARSSVTLSGNVSGAELQTQAAGSLTTAYEGTIAMEVGVNAVLFPGGSRVVPREINSWQPGAAGVEGSALASYGAKAQIGSGVFSLSAVAASRRLLFDLLSDPLVLNGTSFNADGLKFQFVATNNPVLDYRATGVLSQHDGQVLSGLATNQVAGVSTLVTEGTQQTLTVPVDAAYRFKLLLPDDSVLFLKGQIVATRTVPDGPPTIVIEPLAPGITSMTVSWPSGFKLQKATQLLHPDWRDSEAASPATIPFETEGEYFQIVPQ